MRVPSNKKATNSDVNAYSEVILFCVDGFGQVVVIGKDLDDALSIISDMNTMKVNVEKFKNWEKIRDVMLDQTRQKYLATELEMTVSETTT